MVAMADRRGPEGGREAVTATTIQATVMGTMDGGTGQGADIPHSRAMGESTAREQFPV